MMKKLLSVALCAATLAAAPAGAATLVIDSNGILTGAKGVTVGTKAYDVTFVSGTCAQIYGQCDVASFDFTTQADARIAAAALGSQVFVDGALGKFNSTPSLTKGCQGAGTCFVSIIHNVAGNEISSVSYGNDALDSSDRVATGRSKSLQVSFNVARFTLSAPPGAVPEPATWAMMLVGFGAIGAAMRRRRHGVAVRFA